MNLDGMLRTYLSLPDGRTYVRFSSSSVPAASASTFLAGLDARIYRDHVKTCACMLIGLAERSGHPSWSQLGHGLGGRGR
jgi:hypothetical protein